ncbi:hypothetical protein OAM06_00425 [Pelagibacteraceae bacterium]|nr:hypothetical protein [Pelagibacteraceae bacterium]
MKNIMKYMLVALTTLSFSVAQAGDLSITGDAKASYAITSSDSGSGALQQGKGLGVANEFTLSASGELDNGMSWNYAQDIDGATLQDDGKLTLTTDLGTVGVFISEGGLETVNKSSQSVISRPSDTSYGENMLDNFNLSGMNTLQYHAPADLLPFGITGKVAYAPSSGSAASINSYKAGGAAVAEGFTTATTVGTTAAPFSQTAVMGRSATHYQVTAAPIDGLTVGADYVEWSGVTGATFQSPESGAYYATYATGPVSIGYAKGYLATAIGATADVLESIESTKYSVAANINDNFSISYEHEESNPDFTTAATANYTIESTGIQAAYTMGGMTLAIAMNNHENAKYQDGVDIKDTVFSVAMAF